MNNMNYAAVTQEKKIAKQLYVAMDHGLSFPETPGLEHPLSLISEIASNKLVNGIIASAGIYRQAERMGISLSHLEKMITVDLVSINQTNGVQQLTSRNVILSPEQAAEYRPSGYKMILNIYDDNELLIRNIKDFSAFASAGRKFGIKALAEVLFFGNSKFQDVETQGSELLRGCRIAMELGADLLKIPLIKDYDLIEEIVKRFGLPVYILGGSEDYVNFLEEVHAISHFSICGFMIGRNLWQGTDMSRRISEINEAMQ